MDIYLNLEGWTFTTTTWVQNAEEVNTDIFGDLSESWKRHYARRQKEIDKYDLLLKSSQRELHEPGTNAESKNLPGLVIFQNSPLWFKLSKIM